MNGGGQNALFQRHHAGNGFHAASGAQHVPSHGFGGADQRFARARLAQRIFDGERFQLVVHGRAGAVRVDVQRAMGLARLLHGQAQRLRAAHGLWMRRGDVIGVAGVAVAHDFGVDVRAARLRVLVFFQREDARALAQHKALAARIEGQGRLFGIRFLAERLQIGEPSHGQGQDGGLRAARQNGVGIAVLNGVERFANRVRGRGAGGDHRQARPLRAIADGDVASGNVADHHGYEERRHARRATGEQLFGFVHKGLHSTDAAAHVHAEAFGRDRAAQTALAHGLLGGGQRVEREGIAAAGEALIDAEGLRVEILHFARELHLVIRGIEARDRADAGHAVYEILKERFCGISHRADDAHAGYDYAMHAFHLTCSVRRRSKGPRR